MKKIILKKRILTTQDLLENTYRIGKKISESDGELLPVFSERSMKEIGVAPRLLCHRLGLIHKVVYLIILNDNNELLIQVRGDGRIDVPVGGHVSADDKSEIEALTREAYEELGIQLKEDDVKPYKEYFQEGEYNPQKPYEINRELRQLYTIKLPHDIEVRLNAFFSNRVEKEAVKSIKWITYDRIQEYLVDKKLAGGLKYSLPYIEGLLNSLNN